MICCKIGPSLLTHLISKEIIYETNPHSKGTLQSIPVQEKYAPTHYKYVPSISLSGEWLRQTGFDIEDKINVFISNDMLVIKKDTSEEESASSK